MKVRTVTGRAFLIFLFISLIASIISMSGGLGAVCADRGNSATMTSSPAIRIYNDTQLASLVADNDWKGNGTYSSPYIIENLNINVTDGGNAIFIGNTSAYLTISNCRLDSVKDDDFSTLSVGGIALYNVTNAFMEDNNCCGYFYGIYLSGSNHNTLSSNNCTGGGIGVLLLESSNNTVSNNSCLGYEYGLQIVRSNLNNISSNTCRGAVSGVSLAESRNNTVSNNICLGNHSGMQLLSSSYNAITNNRCSCTDTNQSASDGLELQDSSHNTLLNNNCSGEQFGACMTGSCDNTISSNSFSGKYYGIYLDPSSENNNFSGNIGNFSESARTGNHYDVVPVFVISAALFIIVTILVISGRKRKTT